jgi:hypothetical protein
VWATRYTCMKHVVPPRRSHLEELVAETAREVEAVQPRAAIAQLHAEPRQPLTFAGARKPMVRRQLRHRLHAWRHGALSREPVLLLLVPMLRCDAPRRGRLLRVRRQVETDCRGVRHAPRGARWQPGG